MKLLLILMMAASSALCILAFWLENRKNPLPLRLAKHLGEKDTASRQEDENSSPAQHGALAGVTGKLLVWGENLAGKGAQREELEILLARAGWRGESILGQFMLIKYGMALCTVLFSLIFISDGKNFWSIGTMALSLGSFFIGGLVPELWVKAKAAKRQNVIERNMPDALDLMVICAEAGLPFPRIVKVVAKELALSAPILADELATTSAELQLLPDRSLALRHLAERTRVSSVESMVATLIQAERYGTPLAQALRNIAAESRNTLILTLEERAGKLPARLSIPLMTLILPPVVALVATPALMRVIRSLTQ